MDKDLRLYPFISSRMELQSVKVANVKTKEVHNISLTIDGIWTNELFMEPTDIRKLFREYPNYIKPITEGERMESLLTGVKVI